MPLNMSPEVSAACRRIAIRSGALLTLSKLQQSQEISRQDWLLCLQNWLTNGRHIFRLLLILMLTLGVLPFVWNIELSPNNKIEHLRPLIAQLESSKGSSGQAAPRPQAYLPTTPQPESIRSTTEAVESTVRSKVQPKPQQPKKKTTIQKPAKEPVVSSTETITGESVATNATTTSTNSQSLDSVANFSGEGSGNGASNWGSQQTALDKRAPMHFREIDETQAIWVSETEVTQRQWVALMGLDLSVVSGHWNQAVDGISWCKALEYANRLSKHEKRKPVYRFKGRCESGGLVIWDKKSDGYRLLLEAEWLTLAEYAPLENLNSTTNNRGVGNVYTNQQPQRNGLYGLQGNAAEWIWASSEKKHQKSDSAVAVRKCVSDEHCRQTYSPSDRPLGTGLRLARGPLMTIDGSDI